MSVKELKHLLIIYVGYLVYTGSDLPGDSEEIINPLLDKAEELKDKAVHTGLAVDQWWHDRRNVKYKFFLKDAK